MCSTLNKLWYFVGIVWDAQTINTYLHNPKKFIPGTKRKVERHNLIAYLETRK